MCGYCYEGIILSLVGCGQRYTKGYRFSYLQESDNIKTEIQQLEDPNIPEPLIDLAFCRLYDHYFDKIKNMGNAGRNVGEYYTPRPLIKTIVKVVGPK